MIGRREHDKMFRHISIFTLENKKEINRFVNLLNEVEKCPLIARQQVGIHFAEIPTGEMGPDFGDVVQIIDFETKEDLDLYPSSKEHTKLFQEGPKMKKVTAIDYEFEK